MFHGQKYFLDMHIIHGVLAEIVGKAPRGNVHEWMEYNQRYPAKIIQNRKINPNVIYAGGLQIVRKLHVAMF